MNNSPSKMRFLFPFLAGVLVAAPSFVTAQERGSVSTADQTFVKKAAQDGKAEVELGKLAADRAQNDQVKQFGRQMSEEHARANEKLSALARKKGIEVPRELSEEHKELKKSLSGLKGEEFDKKYISAMVQEHDKDVDEFEKQSREGRDTELRNFAAQTLPNLKHHLQMAQSLEKESAQSSGQRR